MYYQSRAPFLLPFRHGEDDPAPDHQPPGPRPSQIRYSRLNSNDANTFVRPSARDLTRGACGRTQLLILVYATYVHAD